MYLGFSHIYKTWHLGGLRKTTLFNAFYDSDVSKQHLKETWYFDGITQNLLGLFLLLL